MQAGDGARAEQLKWGVRSIVFFWGVQELLAQKSGKCGKRFSIRDEGCESEAHSRLCGWASRNEAPSDQRVYHRTVWLLLGRGGQVKQRTTETRSK